MTANPNIKVVVVVAAAKSNPEPNHHYSPSV